MRSRLRQHFKPALLALFVLAGLSAFLGVWLVPAGDDLGGGGTIVFAADRWPQFFGDIYSVTLDGERSNLTHSNFDETDPLLSPDGTRVVFFSSRLGYPAVFVIGVDGSGLTQISPKLGNGADWYNASWSPDNRSLSVGESDDSGAKLYLLQPGKEPRVLAGVRSNYAPGPPTPTWSPDGRLIAFEDDWQTSEDGDPLEEARVVTLEGRTVLDVRTKAAYLIPSWSLSGSLAVQLGSSRVSVYDEHGEPLGEFPARLSAWSPDGKRLASISEKRIEIRDYSSGKSAPKAEVYSPRMDKNGDGFVDPDLVWLGNERVAFIGLGTYAGSDYAAINVDTGAVEPIEERLWDAWYACTERGSSCTASDNPKVADTLREDSHFYLQVEGVDGTDRQRLVRVPGCWSDESVWTPAVSGVQFSSESGTIVYESYCVQPFSDLYLISPDGSDLRRLTRAHTFLDDPKWSPDGQQIALTRSDGVGISRRGCPTEVWLADADGTHLHRLTPKLNPGSCDIDSGQRWWANGAKIIYSHCPEDETCEMKVASPSGGKPRNIALPGTGQAWGQNRIAYFGDDGHIWTANPDGSGRRRLTAEYDKKSTHRSLVWSRDGAGLAWLESEEEGGKAVTLVVLRDDRLKRFPLRVEYVSGLAWSPDGSRLVFTGSEPEGHSDVYTIGADGKDLRRLTYEMGATAADWR